MGITVYGDEALKLLELLEKMDEGYPPTEEERAYLESVEELDLPWLDINTLPDSIGNLSNLQRLDLRGTQISVLPESIGNLANLQKLDLSDTKITASPESIGNLANLQELSLSNTQISTLPSSIGNLTNLQSFDLSGTQIRVLPECVGSLTNLQELRLSGVDVLPEFIGNLTNLQSLSLVEVNVLPEFIGNLTNLQSLSLSGVDVLPEFISNLTNLQSLNLSGVDVLPEFISNLTNLQSLNLSGVDVLPEFIGNLANLQSLSLFSKQITALPESIGNLTNLQMLLLLFTQITALPESIGNLTNLQSLTLFRTQISALPEFIGNLTNLQRINLPDTQISALPESIGNLTNLQRLDLSGTQISFLPESIGNLTSLKRLDLSGLHLQQLPRSLFDLGLDFAFDSSSNGINLASTTLATQPISLFHQPRELIQAYYDAPKVTINDAKVIFLGDGGVGKTHTIQRLLAGGEPGDYHPELTPGIEITDYSTTYDGHPVDLRIWDFGGQEIMHAMHRCFLTSRTCYVVMVSNRFGNRTQRARYWLKTIDSFAKGCPVILAVNLWDTDEGIDGVNGELLEREFPNVKKIITYSAKGSDKDHFNRLTEAIAEQANRLDSCGMEFPESWANIRAGLSKRAEKDRYISKADYLEICKKNGETDPQICGWLLEWFNDLGVCFSYHTDKASGQELENYQVLDPRWLVNAVYLIINKGGNYAQQSSLPLKGIWDILTTGGGTSADAKYEESECEYILEVMRKFRLAYREENEKLEFIPALCPDKWEDPPQTEDSHVTYEMRYKYLPDSVLHQLMIYGKEKLKLEQAWSGGMELSNDKGRYHAVIYLREEDSTLEINAYAQEDLKPWELLEGLRSELERINKDLNLDAEDVIVIKTDKQTAHFPVAAVLKAVERRIPTLYAMDGGELEEYRVNDILGVAFDLKKVEEEKKKAEEEGRDMQVEGLTKSTPSIEDLLKQVLDHQERVEKQFTDTLLEILRESREQPVQKLVAEVDAAPQKKKSRLEVMRDLLSDGSNLATVASAVAPKLPTLLALAKGFLPDL